jgi:Cu/Ag efflux protein CusF
VKGWLQTFGDSPGRRKQMNRLMAAAAGALLLAVSSYAAFADVVTGAIKSVDLATHSVTLDDENIYVLPADFDVSVLTVGLAVTFTYEEVDGKRIVSAVSSPG